jgi:N-acetylglutamate synthase-like GNAT family acetyltransferase
MDITLTIVDAWPYEEICTLYQSADWTQPTFSPEQIEKILKHSFCFAVAEHDGHAIGMGRVISDGVSDGYLQDIVVLPQWRNQGIGTLIVTKLIQECHDHDIKWLGIIADPGTEYFYRKFGFARANGYTPMLYEPRHAASRREDPC